MQLSFANFCLHLLNFTKPSRCLHFFAKFNRISDNIAGISIESRNESCRNFQYNIIYIILTEFTKESRNNEISTEYRISKEYRISFDIVQKKRKGSGIPLESATIRRTEAVLYLNYPAFIERSSASERLWNDKFRETEQMLAFFAKFNRISDTRHLGICVVGNKHRTLLGGVGRELASYRF